MKISKIVELKKELECLRNLKGNANFAYSMVKNDRMLTKEIEDINELLKPSEKFNEFSKLRIELLEKNSKKDENGSPIKKQVNQNIVTYDIENLDSHKEEMSSLEEKFILELEQKEININFDKIKKSDIPNDITKEQMDVIFDFVE